MDAYLTDKKMDKHVYHPPFQESSLRILLIKNQSFLKGNLVLHQGFHGNHCSTLGCCFKAGECTGKKYSVKVTHGVVTPASVNSHCKLFCIK